MSVTPTSRSTPRPTIINKPTGEKTITLDFGGTKLAVKFRKFSSTKCSLQVTDGPDYISGFQTSICRRKGKGSKTAFQQCRAAIEAKLIEGELEVLKRLAIENGKVQQRKDADTRTRCGNEVDKLIAELRAAPSSPAEENDKLAAGSEDETEQLPEECSPPDSPSPADREEDDELRVKTEVEIERLTEEYRASHLPTPETNGKSDGENYLEGFVIL